jgi:hypothetical protein
MAEPENTDKSNKVPFIFVCRGWKSRIECLLHNLGQKLELGIWRVVIWTGTTMMQSLRGGGSEEFPPNALK